MRILHSSMYGPRTKQGGVTLFELIIFIIIVTLALLAIIRAMALGVSQSYDPVARVKAVEEAQALLDEILSRRFAEDTPTGGIPACGSSDDPDGVCAGIAADPAFDDVGDYDGFTDNSDPNFQVSVQVTPAGDDLPALSLQQARLITVSVSTAGGETVRLSAYRVNF